MSAMNIKVDEKMNHELSNGWQVLFDGKSTKGWHSYGKKEAGQAWEVENGTLFLNAEAKNDGVKSGGDLLTNEVYEDFHLKLEWKVAPKGNSGILFYVQDDIDVYSQTWHSGPEMQLLDNEGHPDAEIFKHRAGDLYDLIPSVKEAQKKAGEWNEVEIISKEGKLDFFLNGVNVVSTTMWNDNWSRLIRESKFKDMPQFGTFKKGHIVLQDHGDPVWFKNIKIKRL